MILRPGNATLWNPLERTMSGENSLLSDAPLPAFSKIEPAGVVSAIDAILADCQARIDAITSPDASRAPQPDLQTQETAAELKLIGERVEPALDAVDEYLDRAVRSNLPQVRIVHGHGSGRLRQAIREHLRAHPLVATQRPGAPNEGGNGATVVTAPPL